MKHNTQAGKVAPHTIVIVAVIAVVVVIVLLFMTGAAKVNFSVSRTGGSDTDATESAADAVPTPAAASPNVYTNAAAGIRLTYPANWRTKEQPGPGALVGFLAPKENASDTFAENVIVSVTDLAGRSITVREVADLWWQQSVTDLGGTATLGERTETTLSGAPAEALTYTAQSGKISGKGRAVVGIVNGKAYVVSYTAEVASFDTFLPDAQRIFDSFRVE